MCKIFFPIADLTIAPSHGVKDDFVRFYGTSARKIVVIPNPVDISRVESLASENININHKPYILAVGRLTPAKGFKFLIQAFAIVVRKTPELNLVILGEGPDKELLERISSDLGIKDKVIFPGFVLNPYPYYKQAEVFVLSSLWEGSPNALIHALVLGVPVVSTDCPSGPRELIENKDLLVPPKSSEALAIVLLRQTQLAHKECHIEIKQKHNIESVIDRWMIIL